MLLDLEIEYYQVMSTFAQFQRQNALKQFNKHQKIHLQITSDPNKILKAGVAA